MTTIRPALDAAARATIAARTEALLRRTGALRDRHAELGDGSHVSVTLDPVALLTDPLAVSELCGLWVARLRDAGGHAVVDVVAGSGLVGGVVAFEMARQLGRPVVYLDEGRRSGGAVAAGDRVLLVDAVAEPGAALTDIVATIEALGGEIVSCDVIADASAEDRATIVSPSSGRVYPLRSLWQIQPFVVGPAALARGGR